MTKRLTILILLTLCLVTVATYSQISERYKLTLQNYKSTFDHLIFGVDPSATSRIDTVLGESELPPFTPPSGLYGVFLIYDSTYLDDSWGEDWSYIDLKPIPNNHDSIEYKFEVFDDGIEYTMKWDKLSENIDSAILIDNYTKGGATFVNMKDSLKINITNPSLRVFLIKLWYKTNTSVFQQNPENTTFLKISPNPCSDNLNIVLDKDDTYKFEVINFLGEKIIEEKLQGKQEALNITILNPGIYFLIVTNRDGFNTIIKFAKI